MGTDCASNCGLCSGLKPPRMLRKQDRGRQPSAPCAQDTHRPDFRLSKMALTFILGALGFARPVPIKRRAGFVTGAGCGMRRPRRDCGPFGAERSRLRPRPARSRKERRSAVEVGGPRTQQCGDAKHSVKAPSAWCRWELQADKTVACGTQAFSCFCGGCLNKQPLPCALHRHTGAMCLNKACGRHVCHNIWRRGRGETPSRSARPFGEQRTRWKRRPARPGAGQGPRGDKSRLHASERDRAV